MFSDEAYGEGKGGIAHGAMVIALKFDDFRVGVACEGKHAPEVGLLIVVFYSAKNCRIIMTRFVYRQLDYGVCQDVLFHSAFPSYMMIFERFLGSYDKEGAQLIDVE